MNPAILARLFQAHTDLLQQHGQQPLDVQQEPGDLWAQGGSQSGGDMGGGNLGGGNIDLSQPQESDPGAMASRDAGDSTMPPSDYQYLDRVEGGGGGDQPPLGVMFGQQQGEPTGDGSNVPMDQLPQGAQEGQYISPMDIKSKRMSTQR